MAAIMGAAVQRSDALKNHQVETVELGPLEVGVTTGFDHVRVVSESHPGYGRSSALQHASMESDLYLEGNSRLNLGRFFRLPNEETMSKVDKILDQSMGVNVEEPMKVQTIRSDDRVDSRTKSVARIRGFWTFKEKDNQNAISHVTMARHKGDDHRVMHNLSQILAAMDFKVAGLKAEVVTDVRGSGRIGEVFPGI
ncbi:hypothetical protein NE237_015598 [Protea cynaroides]|uniref:Uncharacterized protein n=1 Tax=Protea cynaroides TaxID=273540 RepID=A0A9Q0KEB0_9MAGN|nr:hypothetical protein NE237_015598 [Protea cynaroides]